MLTKQKLFVLIRVFAVVACASNLAREQSTPQCFVDTSMECEAAGSGDMASPSRNLVQMSMFAGTAQHATNEGMSQLDRARSHAVLLSKAVLRILGEQPAFANIVAFGLLVVALVVSASFMCDTTVARPVPAGARTPTLGSSMSLPPPPEPRSERVLQGSQRNQEEPTSLLAKLSPRILLEARPSSSMMPQAQGQLSSKHAEQGRPSGGYSRSTSLREQPTFSPPAVPRLAMPTQKAPSYACAELVVPPGSESVLAIRIPAAQQAATKTVVDIVSLDGAPLLKGEISYPVPVAYSFSGNSMMSSPRLSHPGGRSTEVGQDAAITLKRFKVEATHSWLKTPRPGLTDTTLAMGFLATGSRGQPALSVCGPDGSCWGKLEKTLAGHFALLVGSDSMLNMAFKGEYQDHDVQVLGETQLLLAKVEPFTMSTDPDSKFVSVTVRPMVDAGVVLVCALAYLHSLPMPWDN